MANIWRDPIFDRTSHDVAFAIQQIAAWKKSHSHVGDAKIETDKLTVNANGEVYASGDSVVFDTRDNVRVENNVLVMELGVVYDLKGCLNLSDITRIEDDISYLSNLLVGYDFPIAINSKEWTTAGLPTANDMKRIGNNIRSLFNGFYTPSGASPMPEVMLSYHDINAIEYNLHLLKQLVDAMLSAFIKSGTYKCGATNRLPIRR
jgi:hypothetical protein